MLGAIERRAPAGEWRTNVSRAGSARPFDLPAAWGRWPSGRRRPSGADYAGVDLLPPRDGAVFVLEVNAMPGWQGLQEATGIDVAGAIVDHLVDARAGAGGRGLDMSARRARRGIRRDRAADVALPRRSWPACSRRARPSPATCRQGATSPTHATSTFWPARPPLAGRSQARACGRWVRPCASRSTPPPAGPASNTNLGIVLLLVPLAMRGRSGGKGGGGDLARRGAACDRSDHRRRRPGGVRGDTPRGARGARPRAGAGRGRRTDDEPARGDAARRRSRRRSRANMPRRSSGRSGPAPPPSSGPARDGSDVGRGGCRDVPDAARRGARHARRAARAARPAAEEVSRRARAALDAGGVRSAAGRQLIDAMDRRCATRAHAANPGTTADLTAAAIFVVLLGGGWTAA